MLLTLKKVVFAVWMIFLAIMIGLFTGILFANTLDYFGMPKTEATTAGLLLATLVANIASFFGGTQAP